MEIIKIFSKKIVSILENFAYKRCLNSYRLIVWQFKPPFKLLKKNTNQKMEETFYEKMWNFPPA